MSKGKLSVEDVETLQFKTFYGKEKKSLAYIIALMNMILRCGCSKYLTHQYSDRECFRRTGL